MYRKVIQNGQLRRDVIFRMSDGAWIPTSNDNSDYNEFLKLNVSIDDLDPYEP